MQKRSLSSTRTAGSFATASGVDTIDLEAAKRLGIRVANVPNYGAEIEVSDHAAALTLALVRRVVSRHEQVNDGQWGIGQNEPIYRIAGSTLGLLGFGKIARAYLERMRAFGVGEVLVCDPYLPDSVDRPVQRRSSELRRDLQPRPDHLVACSCDG